MKNKFNDQIDLGISILDLWKKKNTIFLISFIFIIFGTIFYEFFEKTYLVKTNIKAIPIFEDRKYSAYNNLTGEKISKIDSEILLNLFIENLKTGEFIKEGVTKFNLLKKEDYKNEDQFNFHVNRISSLIANDITSPTIVNENALTINQGPIIPFWQIKFKINEKHKKNWHKFLYFLEIKSNEAVRKFVLKRFETEIKIKKLSTKFALEDIDTKIQNKIDDYSTISLNRLAFLKEQSAIARELNISKNTLETQEFIGDKMVFTNLGSANSYYLKGYEMIEKEIHLINSRKNINAFMPDLLKLEQERRDILQNKEVDRISSLFLDTPIVDKNRFTSARIDFESTTFNKNFSIFQILGLAFVIGLIVSLLYIYSYNLIQNKK